MKLRASRTRVAALAALLTLGTPVFGHAQTDTARTRVPVKKERVTAPTVTPAQAPVAQAPVAKEPVATVPVARPDTAPRVSKGEVVSPKDTTALPAAVAAHPVAPGVAKSPPVQGASLKSAETHYLFGRSGFYLGVGAGTSVPYNVLSDVGYDSGFDLTIPIGWRRPGRLLGVRGTLAFDQLHADPNGPLPALFGSGPDPKIYAGTVDAVLNFPIGPGKREGRGLTMYALGGGGAYLFRGFGGSEQLGDWLGTDNVGDSRKNVHKWGIQAGAGMEWGLGPTAIFVEGRWVNVFTNGSRAGNDYVRWVPIVVGLTLR